MHVPIWYIPSFYGDIRVEPTGPESCKVIAENLSVQETAALDRLRKTATKKGWLAATEKLDWTGTTKVGAPIDKVAGVIARALKPDRKVVSAVKFSDGTIEEIRTADFDDTRPKDEANGGPYREAVTPDKIIPAKKPKAATTVAAPTRGCPFPDFEPAEIKARRVLTAFLDPGQLEDFRRYNRFLSIGQTTGHRYLITSRHANDELALRRSVLYDVDNSRSICTHDWDVPAAEEMLALHIYLQIPGGERFLRSFPGDILYDGDVLDIDGAVVYQAPGMRVTYEEPDEVVSVAVRRAVNRILSESEREPE